MKLTFKKVILLSALTMLLGVSLVYAVSYEFKPNNSPQTDPMSHSFAPPGLSIPFDAHLRVFAYLNDGLVQASVTITGPELPNPFDNGAPVNVTTLNGTTSTDLQNPLRFLVWPGVYSVFGTYGSAPPQNATVSVTESGYYGEAVLNFGSSPPPPLGHIIVEAWYESSNGGSFVQASVTIIGPLPFFDTRINGTICANEVDPSVFTVAPGVYSVFGTYGSAPPQNATVTVMAGGFAGVFLDFSGFPPP